MSAFHPEATHLDPAQWRIVPDPGVQQVTLMLGATAFIGLTDPADGHALAQWVLEATAQLESDIAARAAPAVTATALAAVWDVICEHGQIKHAWLAAELHARGLRYTSSAVGQALAGLERTGLIRKVQGEPGVWEKLPGAAPAEVAQ